MSNAPAKINCIECHGQMLAKRVKVTQSRIATVDRWECSGCGCHYDDTALVSGLTKAAKARRWSGPVLEFERGRILADADCPTCGLTKASPAVSRYPLNERIWQCRACDRHLSALAVDVPGYELAKTCYSPSKPANLDGAVRLSEALQKAENALGASLAKLAPDPGLDAASALRHALRKANMATQARPSGAGVFDLMTRLERAYGRLASTAIH
jgi:ribosomal protein L37AE/L43A